MKWTTFSHISTGSPVAYCLALMSILSGAEAASYPLVYLYAQHLLNFPASGRQF